MGWTHLSTFALLICQQGSYPCPHFHFLQLTTGPLHLLLLAGPCPGPYQVWMVVLEVGEVVAISLRELLGVRLEAAVRASPHINLFIRSNTVSPSAFLLTSGSPIRGTVPVLLLSSQYSILICGTCAGPLSTRLWNHRQAVSTTAESGNPRLLGNPFLWLRGAGSRPLQQRSLPRRGLSGTAETQGSSRPGQKLLVFLFISEDSEAQAFGKASKGGELAV